MDELEGDGQSGVVAVVKSRKKIDAFDGAVLGVVKMPGDEFGFVCVGLFLNSAVYDETGRGFESLPSPLRVCNRTRKSPPFTAKMRRWLG